MLKDGSVKNESQETSLDRDATSTPEHSRRERCCQAQGINLSLNDWSRILTRVSLVSTFMIVRRAKTHLIDRFFLELMWA